ncbi:unnamed protein product, partial [Scytosiphon promiscuus]
TRAHFAPRLNCGGPKASISLCQCPLVTCGIAAGPEALILWSPTGPAPAGLTDDFIYGTFTPKIEIERGQGALFYFQYSCSHLPNLSTSRLTSSVLLSIERNPH